MKILTISTQKPFATGSGIYLTALIKAFKSLGHEQAMVAGIAADENLDDYSALGVKTYPVHFESEELPFPVVGMSNQMPYPSTLYKNMTEEMTRQLHDAFYKQVSRAVCEFQPDVILCHHLYLLTSWVREWFPKAKIYGMCHNSDLRQYLDNEKWREGIYKGVNGLQRIFALHGVQKEEITRIFGVTNIKVVGNAIDQTTFHQKSMSGEPLLCPPSEKKTLLFVGKLSLSKGAFSLVKALKFLKTGPDKLRLIMAGGFGNEEEMSLLRELIEQSDYEILTPGLCKPYQLADLYRTSDAFVIPSFFDGLPLVNFEAIACGCPAICTDLPGVKQWCDENVPGHGIRFIQAPEMIGTDVPREDSLPAYEERLAAAIDEALASNRVFAQKPDLSALTWEGVAKRFLAE